MPGSAADHALGDSWIMIGNPGEDYPEGHRWSFARQFKEIAPEDWGATRPS